MPRTKKPKKKALVARKASKSGKPKLKAHMRYPTCPDTRDLMADDTLDAQRPATPRPTPKKPKASERPKSTFKNTLDYAEAMEFDPAFVHVP